uniref:Uncharacterized protein n=1 Tax=Onchocerca volvulus TaxID=6282 RepID=A0A8R1TLN4_ONCVO
MECQHDEKHVLNNSFANLETSKKNKIPHVYLEKKVSGYQ